jgi:hypothetical protein
MAPKRIIVSKVHFDKNIYSPKPFSRFGAVILEGHVLLFTFFSSRFDLNLKHCTMKAIVLKINILLVALVFGFTANAQEFSVKPGDVLTYHVKTPTAEYDFTVTLKTWRPDLSFDWVMSGGVNQKGSITFNNADASDAMGINNFFNPGAVTLKGKTSVWVSAKVFKLLASKATANITIDNAAIPEAFINCEVDRFAINLNGSPAKFNNIIARNNAGCTKGAGAKEIRILNDVQNPLIVYMDMAGWTIELITVTQQQ